MAKIVLTNALVAVYYTGIEYLETSIRPATLMQDNTIYIVDKVTASKLLNKGVVSRLDERVWETSDEPTGGKDVQTVPAILALSVGAHAPGAKDNEADMAAYKANTPEELNQPTVDGEGLELNGDTISVEHDTVVDTEGEHDTVVDTEDEL